MNVTSNVEQDYLKLYLNVTLHLSLYFGELFGVQAWVESESWWMIEYINKEGGKIRSQYGNEELWKKVLKEIENHI